MFLFILKKIQIPFHNLQSPICPRLRLFFLPVLLLLPLLLIHGAPPFSSIPQTQPAHPHCRVQALAVHSACKIPNPRLNDWLFLLISFKLKSYLLQGLLPHNPTCLLPSPVTFITPSCCFSRTIYTIWDYFIHFGNIV